MHGPIIRTLLKKELLRLAGNRGALAVVGLLAACALLLAVFDQGSPALAGSGGLRVFWVDYWEDGLWIDSLRAAVPPELRDRIHFRRVSDIPTDRHGVLQYGRGEGTVQLRLLPADGPGPRFKVWFWYAGDDPDVLTPFAEWFWSATHRYCYDRAVAVLPPDRQTAMDARNGPVMTGTSARLTQELHHLYRERLTSLDTATVPAVVPDLEVQQSALRGVEPRQAVAVALVLFALYFACTLLLPSMTCEEREQGLLLAQALSPASPLDLLTAKAVAYAGLGTLLALALAALDLPSVALLPFFVLVVLITAAGAFGLGVTITSLVRTQRAASTTALGYALTVAIVTVVSQRTGFAGLSAVFLESYLPPLFLAAFNDGVSSVHWNTLGIVGLLAGGWVGVGTVLFRRYGLR